MDDDFTPSRAEAIRGALIGHIATDRRSPAVRLLGAAALLLVGAAAGVGGAVAAYGATGTPPAAGDHAPTSTDPDDVPPDEPTLEQIADGLSDLVGAEGSPTEAGDGFAGMRVGITTGTIDVYWVGEPGSRIADYLAEVPSRFDVEIHPARYSLAEMTDAVTRLFRAKYDQGDEVGFTIVKAGPTVEGSGIAVGYVGSADPDDVAAWAADAAQIAISSAAPTEAIHSLTGSAGLCPPGQG
ncbi:hypothetical protein [Homoserinibacter sp. GY 40078]|uniref:hypothetical protein n=1 Tax=Homoserinibacter sp. GY 40078 TaxID=2603275 RepID=UPI0011CA59D9|nr:hypothetical protein [Homoserinibacter sp. GY 40078]TXK18679.1 hypothetical protein FVQ89_01670 [Homoserinibacter sp. GY 40078]